MPVKKISDPFALVADNKQLGFPHGQKQKETSPAGIINLLILLILLVFGSSVCYQVYYDLEGDGKSTQNAAKGCLVDFQERNCNPLQLSGPCVELYMCIQNQKPNGIISKTWAVVTISIKSIRENLTLPAVFISVLLLYKIAWFMTKKEDAAIKND